MRSLISRLLRRAPSEPPGVPPHVQRHDDAGDPLPRHSQGRAGAPEGPFLMPDTSAPGRKQKTTPGEDVDGAPSP